MSWDAPPLLRAARFGRYKVVEWLMASGRDLGDLSAKGICFQGSREYTSLENARKEQRADVVGLLERFRSNQAQTGQELRVELRFSDELAAVFFALMVFL